MGLDPFPPRCLSLTSLFPTAFSLSYLVGGLTLSLTNTDFPKSIFNRLGVFRSVRHLEVHKRMRSSDATCCAILGVNTCFFSLRVRQPSYRASRSPKTWNLTHSLVPMRLPKTIHLIMMASKFFSSSKMSKTGKNQKNPL